MPRLFSAEGNVSGYQSNGPEVNSNAGSPHAASIGAGAASVGGQHPQPATLNTGGKSFLNRTQQKQAKPDPGPEEEQTPGAQPGNTPAALPPGAGSPAALPPGSGGGSVSRVSGTNPAPGGMPGGGTSGWTWTANVVNRVSPSYGGAAYNGGGGGVAQAISNTSAPRAAISSGKVIQGTVEP